MSTSGNRLRERVSGPTAKAPHYRPLQTLPGLGDRRRYLTSETAEVLFERAMWLELVVPKNSAVDGLLNFTASFESGETHAIRIDRPRLVLFEYGSGKKVAAANDRVTADILRTGFLCLDVWFPETALEGTQPSVGNLLELNEVFRFWRGRWGAHAVEKGYS